MGEGLSYEAFAGHLKVSRQTIYTWEKQYPDFSEAKSVAVEVGRLWWEKISIQYLINEYQEGTINATIWIFTMKNRFGWRDRRPDESDHIQIQHETSVSDEQLAYLVGGAKGVK